MMLSHMFAVFSIGALVIAELTRTISRRRVDWPVWTALILPLGVGVAYIPLVQRFERFVYPQRFQGGLRMAALFFFKVAAGIWKPFVAACLGVSIIKRLKKHSPNARLIVGSYDYALATGLILIVCVINLMLMIGHEAFFERYCITSALALFIVAVFSLGAWSGYRTIDATCVLALFLSAGVGTNFLLPAIHFTEVGKRAPFDKIKPELPFVAASGLTFLEMDHYESAPFVHRLYYLTDQRAAIEYAHATIFENMAAQKTYFPIRANVERYEGFVAAHRHFLVAGTIGYPEDWLLRKLIHDGAVVSKIASAPLAPYKDRDVYEIIVPEGSSALQR
jgi:hypothetical protein